LGECIGGGSHKAPVYEENVCPVRKIVDPHIRMGFCSDSRDEGASVQRDIVRGKRLSGRFQKCPDAQAQVVDGTRLDKGTEARNIVIFEEAEIHGVRT
jgi:hypothetical protein